MTPDNNKVKETLQELPVTQPENMPDKAALRTQLQKGRERLQALSPITPTELTPQAVVDVPTPAPATELASIATDAEVQAEDAFTQQQQQAAETTQATKETALSEYLKGLQEQQGIATLEQQAFSTPGGVDDITVELNDINDKIRREQMSLRRAKERIQEQGGGLASGAAAEIGNLERESFAKQADLSVIQLATQGRYDAAKAAADRVVDAKLEQQKNYNEALKFAYDEAKEDWSTAEQREFETLLDNRNRALDAKREEEKSIYDLALQAQLDGAPTDVVQAMMASDTRDQALAAGGSYIGLLDRQAKQASIRASIATADAREYELKVAKNAEADRLAAIQNGQITPEQSKTIDEIDSQFRSEPIVKDYNEAVAKRFAFEEIMNNGVEGVQDLQLVYDFMKSVDPTSVVRESEFDNAAKSGNIFAGQYTKFNKGYLGEGGQLPEPVKESFLNAANAAYEGRQSQYFNLRDEFGKKINRRIGSGNGANYLTAYESGAPALPADQLESARTGQIVEVNGVTYRKLQDGNLEEI